MLSFFRRKKPQDAPATEAPKTQHYSAEELAAAFPSTAPIEDKEPAPVAVPAEPAPVEPPPAAAVPVAVERTPVIPAPAAPVPAAPAPTAQIDVAPIAPPAIEPAPAPLPEPTPAPVSDDLPAAASVDAVPAPAGKPGWRERLRNSVIARSFGGLFSRNPKLDDDLLDELETALITADVGVGATTDLVEGLRKRMKSREFADANALLAALRAELIAILQPVAKPLVIDRNAKPFVVLTVGVNGVGKTTTIGKLAKRFKDDGHSLMLAAGDTFRAAAVAQLQAWGERNGVAVVAQGQNADAASVAFDALQAGKARGTSVLIADTAGRLHTQSGLMNELGKIRRVLGKIDPTAPHEVLMVIDGTTGQNALSQLRQFNAAVNVTGLVVTKLDGTAKGGVVFALAREFGIPIRFAGIGERPEDLRVFDPEAFVDALLPEALGA
ncbi:signal recognition particle-docking protein FtsY [Stenotrophomonas sp. CC120222-04]|uniref:signal recognition particle-docking protein FtsY n=1 Tax=Stenotrophomonas sp. CC120222-04 TaxID=1378088 RepID=UPI000B63F369|nr:signal recognition particle-docking protein FtsY [Stenotrophomonas sp. CC120222-04]SNT81475.1 signal recognition particle-docking protein FtsY [Stenotrophomonas sp. CC120222-04]